MTPIAEENVAALYHCAWQGLLTVVPKCDAVIVDAPYSEKTHKGHDDLMANGPEKLWHHNGTTEPMAPRRAISYGAWTAGDVHSFVSAWHPVCDGWIVSITDHVLAPEWVDALDSVGRYVFAPIPYVAPGSRVRLSGDGPSNWTTWIVVARPRSREMAKWGTLPGAYVLPPGMSEKMPVVGGKPPWLMHRLVEDYSRPGGLVVDPCCGAGTTGIGAIRSGRRAILGDLNREHVDIAAQWIRSPYGRAPGQSEPLPEGQTSLFGLIGGEQ